MIAKSVEEKADPRVARPKVLFDPAEMEDAHTYKILTGCVVPRPIGFISSMSREGVLNAAPFSFFNALSHKPPLVGFSVAPLLPSGRRKDTLSNVMESGEFVVNIVSEEIVRAQDICAGEFPADVDEFAKAGLTAVPSHRIKTPRVEESPVNFECRVEQVLPLPESIYTFVIGRILCMHVREDLVMPGNRINLEALAAVGRMTGNTYSRASDVFTLDYDTYEHLS
jgi:flavin reductase (DIM6/NTAB) family NADH-FMN oxidoreductase RutF